MILDADQNRIVATARCIFFAALITCVPAACGGGGGGGGGPTIDANSHVGIGAPAPKIAGVQVVQNGIVAPRLAVRFEEFDAPVLDQLRDREQLEAVIAGADSEFEKMLALKEWVAEQWPAGSPSPYPPWNAIDILDWIRLGVTGGFCAQYSQVLLQSMASLGMTARYVEIGSTYNPYAHFVIEAWSNDYNKWVVLDADYNLHFERDGIPLSALEVHDALLASQLGDVDVVQGEFREGHPDPEVWPKWTVELYYYLRFHLKANHLSVTNEPPFDRYGDMVEWSDEATVPWEQSTEPSSYRKERLTNQVISDPGLLNSALNQVVATVDSQTEDEIVLSFQNNVLDFERYQIRLSHPRMTAGPWQDLDSASFVWRPSVLAHVLEVRGVNTRGVPGFTTIVVADLTLHTRR
ncbi:MAG TPA: transglutaminase domain-containing protein [Steroidobacteraceae bacterium]|nr:transglutaminase domain-containing protein [Steroidobacteraceae bacterium]